MAESEEELKSLLMKVKEESENLAWNLTLKQLSWFVLMFDKKQQNSVKQLSFNKKNKLKKKCYVYRRILMGKTFM